MPRQASPRRTYRFNRARFVGCFAALAIGAAVVLGQSWLFSLISGRPLNLEAAASVLLFQTGIVATPFLFLALAAIASGRAWLAALAPTLALWGYALYERLSDHWRPGSGPNLTLGLLLIASPLLITPIAVAVARRGRTAARRGR